VCLQHLTSTNATGRKGMWVGSAEAAAASAESFGDACCQSIF